MSAPHETRPLLRAGHPADYRDAVDTDTTQRDTNVATWTWPRPSFGFLLSVLTLAQLAALAMALFAFVAASWLHAQRPGDAKAVLGLWQACLVTVDSHSSNTEDSVWTCYSYTDTDRLRDKLSLDISTGILHTLRAARITLLLTWLANTGAALVGAGMLRAAGLPKLPYLSVGTCTAAMGALLTTVLMSKVKGDLTSPNKMQPSWCFNVVAIAFAVNFLSALLSVCLRGLLVAPPEVALPRPTRKQFATGLGHLHVLLCLCSMASTGGYFHYNGVLFLLFFAAVWRPGTFKKLALVTLALSIALDCFVGLVYGSEILENGSDFPRIMLAFQILSLGLKPISMFLLALLPSQSTPSPELGLPATREHAPPTLTAPVAVEPKPRTMQNSSSPAAPVLMPTASPSSRTEAPVIASAHVPPRQMSQPASMPAVPVSEALVPTTAEDALAEHEDPGVMKKKKKRKRRLDGGAAAGQSAAELADDLESSLHETAPEQVAGPDPEEALAVTQAAPPHAQEAFLPPSSSFAEELPPRQPPATQPSLASGQATLPSAEDILSATGGESVPDEFIFRGAADVDVALDVSQKEAPKRKARRERQAQREAERQEAVDDVAPLAAAPESRARRAPRMRASSPDPTSSGPRVPVAGLARSQSMEDLAGLRAGAAPPATAAVPDLQPATQAQPPLRRAGSLAEIASPHVGVPGADADATGRQRSHSLTRPRSTSATAARGPEGEAAVRSMTLRAARSRSGSLTRPRSDSASSTRSLRHTESAAPTVDTSRACPKCGRRFADFVIVEIHARSCVGPGAGPAMT